MSWRDSRARGLAYKSVVKARYEVEKRVTIPDGVKRTLTLPARANLGWLATVYGSDKGVTAHRYVDVYRRHLADLRHDATRVLEIGIYKGGSLRMWRDYFPNAEVYGLDIEDITVRGTRIHTLQGDQSADDVLARVRELGPFDLIVDDGSHINRHVLASFAGLYDIVKPGGWYVIEDMQTAYIEKLYEGGPPGFSPTSVTLVKDLVDAVNAQYVHEQYPAEPALPAVAELHVYPKIAFMRKAAT